MRDGPPKEFEDDTRSFISCEKSLLLVYIQEIAVVFVSFQEETTRLVVPAITLVRQPFDWSFPVSFVAFLRYLCSPS